jgi:hypothetical protein
MAEPSIKDIAYRTAASVFGGPVDLATMVMRPFGYKTPDTQVMGGSEWIGKKMEEAGLVSSARAPLTEFIASVAVPTPGGIAKGAALAAPAIGGMFIGKGARTWDALAAQKAKLLADMGTDPRTIWQQTGTWKGPDGKWRQEISDEKSFYRGSKAACSSYAEDVHLHPELYKAYPSAGGSRVTESPHKGGSFNPASRQITVGPMDANSTMLHEQQHQIQGLEGFATGGAPGSNGLSWDEMTKIAKNIYENSRNTYDDPLLAELYAGSKPLKPWDEMFPVERAQYYEEAQKDVYRRLAGEAEARAVEKRMNMTPSQRQATFPEESYDVPLNELIIRTD